MECLKPETVAIQVHMGYNESINKNRKRVLYMEKNPKRANKVSRNLLVVALIVILICITIIAAMLIQTRKNQVESRTVAFGLKDMGELATQAGYFTNVQSSTSTRQLFGMDIPFTKSKYIYSYDGVVKAGLDFAKIDVQVDDENRTVTVKLPEIEILDVSIDNDSLKIYDESQSIFTPLHIADVNEAQIELKKQVRQTAIDNGILDEARRNAKTIIGGFLSGTMDLKDYAITFEEER